MYELIGNNRYDGPTPKTFINETFDVHTGMICWDIRCDAVYSIRYQTTRKLIFSRHSNLVEI